MKIRNVALETIWNIFFIYIWLSFSFKGGLLCKNNFYKVFEHICMAAVYENNQPIMLKIH